MLTLCVPGCLTMAIFCPGVSQKGLGREKGPFVAIYRRRVFKMSWLWQDMRAMHPKSPANRCWRIHHVNILPGRGPFRCTNPSNHARRANLAIPGCFVWELRARRGARRGEGYRRSACGSRTPPPLCARRRGAFAGSSHAALSCPRSRARCSCCCACSRVRRARCPPLLREARTFRGALCEVSAFASRRWVCLSPFTRRLCLVRSFRGGARC